MIVNFGGGWWQTRSHLRPSGSLCDGGGERFVMKRPLCHVTRRDASARLSSSSPRFSNVLFIARQLSTRQAAIPRPRSALFILFFPPPFLWWIAWTANLQLQQSLIPRRRCDSFHLPTALKIIYREETSQTTTCSPKQAAELSNRKSALVPDL